MLNLKTAGTAMFTMAFTVGLVGVTTVTEAATNDPYVNEHMNWCEGDWGLNEGAQEAITYANAAVAAGYPNAVSGIISIVNGIHPNVAGNILKRKPVLDAARALVHVSPDLAVKLALTCQYHNPTTQSMLHQRPGAVADWLRP